MKRPEVSIIISTYNQPKWLEKVVWSYTGQTFKDFELVIADDGSDEITKELIATFKSSVSFEMQHIWHEDKGFRKTVILNKALLASKGSYVIFTDGDCLARKDFVKTHLSYREKGWFLSGGYFKLPKNISDQITKNDILQQKCFEVSWLLEKGLSPSFKLNKLRASGWKQRFLNTFTTTKATWDGMNASGWRSDLLAVNGFDERMQYGGEDRELGERLFNLGIKAKQIRYSAICLHLYHERGYVEPNMILENNKIRTFTKKKRIIKTPYGIKALGD